VTIVKSGFFSAYASPDKKSSTVWYMHHGERYLCTAEADGFYEIVLVNGQKGYVSSSSSYTSLAKGDTANAVTLSNRSANFSVYIDERVYYYSQPKTSAKTSRSGSQDGWEWWKTCEPVDILYR